MESDRRLDVVVVDDKPGSIRGLLRELGKDPHVHEQVFSDFDQAKSSMAVEVPDVLVTDLLKPGAGVPGVKLAKWAWENHVFPIAVYTAQTDAYDGPRHPFIRVIQKGAGSEHQVMTAIDEYRPYLDALRSAQEKARRDMVRCIRDADPPLWATDDVVKSVDVLMRAARRRFAAMLDEGDGDRLHPWEQYLCPPLSTSLCTGDILRRAEGAVDRPKNFFVVLTPSCDLVAAPGRLPKVARVLVAKCVGMKEALRRGGLKLPEETEDERQILRALGQGYKDGLLFLPTLRGEIPLMAATLRSLELLPWKDIVEKGCEGSYWRVASVDSPFRELVSWAYLQNAARPGLPDRDVHSWLEDIRRQDAAGRGGAS